MPLAPRLAMNNKVSKKLRKLANKHYKANWFEYVEATSQWPFRVRLRFCWQVMTRKWAKKKKRAVVR